MKFFFLHICLLTPSLGYSKDIEQLASKICKKIERNINCLSQLKKEEKGQVLKTAATISCATANEKKLDMELETRAQACLNCYDLNGCKKKNAEALIKFTQKKLPQDFQREMMAASIYDLFKRQENDFFETQKVFNALNETKKSICGKNKKIKNILKSAGCGKTIQSIRKRCLPNEECKRFLGYKPKSQEKKKNHRDESHFFDTLMKLSNGHDFHSTAYTQGAASNPYIKWMQRYQLNNRSSFQQFLLKIKKKDLNQIKKLFSSEIKESKCKSLPHTLESACNLETKTSLDEIIKSSQLKDFNPDIKKIFTDKLINKGLFCIYSQYATKMKSSSDNQIKKRLSENFNEVDVEVASTAIPELGQIAKEISESRGDPVKRKEIFERYKKIRMPSGIDFPIGGVENFEEYIPQAFANIGKWATNNTDKVINKAEKLIKDLEKAKRDGDKEKTKGLKKELTKIVKDLKSLSDSKMANIESSAIEQISKAEELLPEYKKELRELNRSLADTQGRPAPARSGRANLPPQNRRAAQAYSGSPSRVDTSFKGNASSAYGGTIVSNQGAIASQKRSYPIPKGAASSKITLQRDILDNGLKGPRNFEIDEKNRKVKIYALSEDRDKIELQFEYDFEAFEQKRLMLELDQHVITSIQEALEKKGLLFEEEIKPRKLHQHKGIIETLNGIK